MRGSTQLWEHLDHTSCNLHIMRSHHNNLWISTLLVIMPLFTRELEQMRLKPLQLSSLHITSTSSEQERLDIEMRADTIICSQYHYFHNFESIFSSLHVTSETAEQQTIQPLKVTRTLFYKNIEQNTWNHTKRDARAYRAKACVDNNSLVILTLFYKMGSTDQLQSHLNNTQPLFLLRILSEETPLPNMYPPPSVSVSFFSISVIILCTGISLFY